MVRYTRGRDLSTLTNVPGKFRMIQSVFDQFERPNWIHCSLNHLTKEHVLNVYQIKKNGFFTIKRGVYLNYFNLLQTNDWNKISVVAISTALNYLRPPENMKNKNNYVYIM